MTVEICGTCRFVRKVEVKDGSREGTSAIICRRFPQLVETTLDNWCGEHQEREGPKTTITNTDDDRGRTVGPRDDATVESTGNIAEAALKAPDRYIVKWIEPLRGRDEKGTPMDAHVRVSMTVADAICAQRDVWVDRPEPSDRELLAGFISDNCAKVEKL